MKKSIALSILFLFLIGTTQAQNSNSPIDTGNKSSDTCHKNVIGPFTDVITLAACSPGFNSFYIERYNKSGRQPVLEKRVSVNVNRLTAFRIKNINPLRYRFSINNQFVTQFFDTEDLLSRGAVGDTAIVQPGEIEALTIFDLAKVADGNDKVKELARIRSEIDAGKLILDSLFQELLKAHDFGKNEDFTPEDKTYRFKSTNKAGGARRIVDSLNRRLDELYNLSDKQLMKMSALINSYAPLTRGEDNTSVLKNIENMCKVFPNDSVLANTSAAIKEAAVRTREAIEKFSQNLYNTKYSFSFGGRIVSENYWEELFSYKPQEVMQQYTTIASSLEAKESFVVFASMEIGKLLQTKLIEYSRFHNGLKNETCIKDVEKDVINIANKAETVFNFIQNICANLNTYINYYQLSNSVFNNVVARINNNYRSLLKTIKVFDYINRNTETVYELPTYNNLRNVDMIRYTVTRVDRQTGKREEHPFDLWIKGGLKVDFSVAILGSQIFNDTYNKMQYYYSDTSKPTKNQQILATDTVLLNRANAGKYSFALGGMVNLLWRSGACWVTPGLSVGIAYGSNQNLQFLASLSLQFGKTERLIAHFGFSGGLANYLDRSRYSVIDTNNIRPKISEGSYLVRGRYENIQELYQQRFVIKPFFGISYNLSKRNPLNAVGTLSKGYDGAFPQ